MRGSGHAAADVLRPGPGSCLRALAGSRRGITRGILLGPLPGASWARGLCSGAGSPARMPAGCVVSVSAPYAVRGVVSDASGAALGLVLGWALYARACVRALRAQVSAYAGGAAGSRLRGYPCRRGKIRARSWKIGKTQARRGLCLGALRLVSLSYIVRAAISSKTAPAENVIANPAKISCNVFFMLPCSFRCGPRLVRLLISSLSVASCCRSELQSREPYILPRSMQGPAARLRGMRSA